MKTKLLIIAGLLVFLASGCLIKSLHPFYTEKDLVFRKELPGNWLAQDSSLWNISQRMRFDGFLQPEKGDNAYNILMTDEKGTGSFIAHLFRLDGSLYLDFYPDEVQVSNSLASYHLIPAHTLAKVEVSADEIVIRWYNEEWLLELFNQNKVRIPHERIPYDLDDQNPDNYQVILTASTEELQKFLLKYGNDPNAMKTEDKEEYTFRLKRI